LADDEELMEPAAGLALKAQLRSPPFTEPGARITVAEGALLSHLLLSALLIDL
jgi:hypothetical protein